MQHVATWKEGDEKWAYHPDAFANIATHKVSLDPYRLESRRILACIKDVLPALPIQRVEKASVDEVFLDLSAQIHSILVERYSDISGPAPYDDPTEFLPRPPTTVLDWNTDALVDLDSSETEDDDPDWDDVAILVGSEIVRSVRAAIRERLKYTCSAGIGRNKMIAKLGSAHKKPNQQTIIRNRAVQHFLSDFKFTKIRNLGGKLGEEVVSKFDTDQIKDLLAVSLEQLKFKIGDDTGSWVYGVIRGEDLSEVNSQTQIKSMLSAKSFRPTINSFEQAARWIRIFVSDIFSRLREEGVLENKRRPKTINLHHRQGSQMRSRQAPIPTGKSVDEKLLYEISEKLLSQIIIDGRAWPCSNLSLSVGGFEDGPSGNRGIDGFLVRGEEAKAMRPTTRDMGSPNSIARDDRSEKRRKINSGAIQRFFVPKETSCGEADEEHGTIIQPMETESKLFSANEEATVLQNKTYHCQDTAQEGKPIFKECKDYEAECSYLPDLVESRRTHQLSTTSYLCDECNSLMPFVSKGEHDDWHFARSLQAQEHIEPKDITSSLNLTQSKAGASKTSSSYSTAAAGNNKSNAHQIQKKTEKGQSRLVFG